MHKPIQAETIRFLLTDIRDESFQIVCTTRAEVLEACQKRSAQLGERFLPFLYSRSISIDGDIRYFCRLVEEEEWCGVHS